MLLSMTTGTYLRRGVTEEGMLDMMKKGGFDAMDFSFFYSEYYDESTGSEMAKPEYFKNLRKLAEDKGIVFNQAHAPFGSSFEKAEETEKRFNDITASMRNAALLGVKNIVVHPCQHLVYEKDGVPEQLFEINIFCLHFDKFVVVRIKLINNVLTNHGFSTINRIRNDIGIVAVFVFVTEFNVEEIVTCFEVISNIRVIKSIFFKVALFVIKNISAVIINPACEG